MSTRDALDSALSIFCPTFDMRNPFDADKWPKNMSEKARLQATVRDAENIPSSSHLYGNAGLVCTLSRQWWKEEKGEALFTWQEEQQIISSKPPANTPPDTGTPPRTGPKLGAYTPNDKDRTGPMLGRDTPKDEGGQDR